MQWAISTFQDTVPVLYLVRPSWLMTVSLRTMLAPSRLSRQVLACNYKNFAITGFCLQEGRVSLSQDFISGGRGRPPANILIPAKGNWLRNNSAADSFYIMKLCSRLLVLYCQNLYERRQMQVFDPHFEAVRGGVEPWLMARWKACIRLPIRHNWTFFTISYA